MRQREAFTRTGVAKRVPEGPGQLVGTVDKATVERNCPNRQRVRSVVS